MRLHQVLVVRHGQGHVEEGVARVLLPKALEAGAEMGAELFPAEAEQLVSGGGTHLVGVRVTGFYLKVR